MKNRIINVVILELETKTTDTNINNIKHMLLNNTTINDEKKALVEYRVSVLKPRNEKVGIIEALSKHEIGQYMMIIKDSSICSQDIKERIRDGLDVMERNEVDLFFLHTYNDLCQKYTTLSDGLVYTVNPSSSQCVIYAPSAIEIFLKEYSMDKISFKSFVNRILTLHKFTAIACIPNIVFYDIRLVSNDKDYTRTNSCILVNNENGRMNSNDWHLLYVTTIVLMVLFIVFIISFFMKRMVKNGKEW